jgi:tetratricopeptide (TPR) repeat protein
MSGLIAVLRGLFLALLSGLSGVAHLAARNARAVGRATAAGARAVGAKVAPAVKAGAAKAGGRAKAWFFAMPGKTFHFLRGKIVEVLIMLAITAGAAYFLSDSQAIRSERLACWLSDYSNEWFGANEPLAPEKGFRVLVAQLDGDEDGNLTRNVVLSLNGVQGVEVHELCRSLGVPPGQATAKGWRDAEEKARSWLADWHAAVIVWGMPAADDYLRLYVTTPSGSGDLQLYELSKATGFLLPASFDADFSARIQAWVLSGIDVDPKNLLSSAQTDLLIERLPQLRALASVKSKSHEARVSAAMVYFAAFQRSLVLSLRRSRTLPDLNELATVTAGLSTGIDPDKELDLWAVAVLFENMTAALLAQNDGDAAALRATAANYLRVAEHPKMDQWTAAAAFDFAGMARRMAAEIDGSADDMYDALSLLLRSRRLVPPSAKGAQRVVAELSFAKTVQWLSKRVGDTTHLDEAIRSIEAALAVLPQDDDTGNVMSALVLHADLLTVSGGMRHDVATLRQAVREFEAALTPANRSDWEAYYIDGLEKLAQARLVLAGETGADEDYARAIGAFDEALRAWPREESVWRYLRLSERRGEALRQRGLAASKVEFVKTAVADLTAVLDQGVPRDMPLEWFSLKLTTAIALWDISKLEHSDARNTKSVAILRDVVARMAREKNEQLWVQGSNSLVDALIDSALARREAAMLREAAAILRDVMAQVTTRERMLAVWATNQYRLGTVLEHLAEMTRDAAVLADAEDAFRQSMAGRPRAEVPAYWLQAATNAGIVQARRGEVTGNVALVQGAIATFEEALAVPSPYDNMKAVPTRGLAMARTVLSRLTNDPAPAIKARDDMQTVLLRLDKERQTYDWAWTALRHADAAITVGSMANDPLAVGEAVRRLGEVRQRALALGVPMLVAGVDEALARARR